MAARLMQEPTQDQIVYEDDEDYRDAWSYLDVVVDGDAICVSTDGYVRLPADQARKLAAWLTDAADRMEVTR